MSTFEELGVEFQLILKDTLKMIDGLSSNSMRRLLKKTLAHPLEDDLVKLQEKDNIEVTVYNNALELQSIKFSMMVESLKQDAEEERVRLAREARENKIPEGIDVPDYAKETKNE